MESGVIAFSDCLMILGKRSCNKIKTNSQRFGILLNN